VRPRNIGMPQLSDAIALRPAALRIRGWSQRFTEVWRQRDPAERGACLALRSARGNGSGKAVGCYRNNGKPAPPVKTSRSCATPGTSPTHQPASALPLHQP
jgi:hypothetical protein